MRMIKRSVAGILGLMALTACGDLEVMNYNQPSVDDLLANPTRTNIAASSQGLLRTTRSNAAFMVQWMGALGREGYPMATSGASLTGTVQNRLNGGNFPGNSLWTDPYRNIRNANLLFEALALTDELSATEREAALGFAKTIQAYDFLNVILTRWKFGAPIDVGGDPSGTPPPFASREQVLAHVVQLLDEAQGHLAAGGAAFPFRLHSGLAEFDTPARFIPFNRALRARVAVYTEDWSGALQALEASFLDTDLPLDFGARHTFSTGSGDESNPLNRPDLLYAHPRIRDDAQRRADGSPDLRAQTKVATVPAFTVSGITSDAQYTLYTSPSASLVWIKNEELILLRAQANLGLGRLADVRDDVNLIRTESGGLEPIDTLDPAELLDEILYNKRYSLIWEGGHVWIDMRQYGRIADIPVSAADPILNDAMPVPANECFSRSPEPAGCGEIAPITGGG